MRTHVGWLGLLPVLLPLLLFLTADTSAPFAVSAQTTAPLSARAFTASGDLVLSVSHAGHSYHISLSGLPATVVHSPSLLWSVSEQSAPTRLLTLPASGGADGHDGHDHEHEHEHEDGDEDERHARVVSVHSQLLVGRAEWTEDDAPIWQPPSRPTHSAQPHASQATAAVESDEEEEDEDEDEFGEAADGVPRSVPRPLSSSAASSSSASSVQYPQYPAGMQPLLSLVMIVKDEVAGLELTLESTRGHVDQYCLLDTGSTDGTLEVIRRFFDSLPGSVSRELFQEPFVDFSTTRNRALQLAGQHTEFVLMLNGDDRLVGGADMRAFLSSRRGMTAIDEAIYIIPIDYGGVATGRSERLARTRNHFVPDWPHDALNHWRFEGVTHEAYVCNAALQQGAQIIYTSGEFGVYHDISQDTPDKKSARFELDIQLLLADLHAHPASFNAPRNMYYLAQSYYNLERFDEATEWYLKRVDVNYVRPTPWGEDNEKHRAYTLLAYMADKQSRPSGAVEKYWKKSWEACPAAYSLYSLARHYRDHGDTEKARKAAEKCKKVLSRGSPVVCNGDDVLTQKQLPALMHSLRQSGG